MSLQDFEAVYSNDVFYSWFGLNTAEVYRAHRLAGGITSLYRQIGVGCERLTQTIVCDTLSLSAEQSDTVQADLLSAANADAEGLLPVLFLLSNQIDEDIERRYRAARWHILRGVLHGSSTESTYVFCNEVLGYNLADFFNRYSDTLRTEILSIIRDLLT
jgi:hypothetical protein